MSIGLSITGSKELMAALSKYKDKSSAAIQDVVESTAFDVQAEAAKAIQRGSKTGRVYKRGSKTHQASAPGQAPASDTGMLAGSIQAVKLTKLTWQVGTMLRYGEWLEYGTRDIAERPWLRPALDKNRIEFFRRLRAAISS